MKADGRRSPYSRHQTPSELQGRARPVVERVCPQVDGGRYPPKREVGDLVTVEAEVFADGHDELVCDVLWRPEAESRWQALPMEPLGNDRWRGTFPVTAAGRYRFCVRATVDAYATWLRDARVRTTAGQDLTVELLVGADLLAGAAQRANGDDSRRLQAMAEELREASYSGNYTPPGLFDTPSEPGEGTPRDVLAAASDEENVRLVRRYPDPVPGVTSEELPLVVDRAKARFSSWYELFPRSWSTSPDRPGTLEDVREQLDYVSKLGFDVLYLPPIHPIGRTNRKGRNGSRDCEAGDPGSPWAIGAAEGGHTSVHPDLGTIDDFDRLVAEARRRGIDVALDLAFQCSPDHPWVKEHPEWFRWLPDGTVRYAENPPKRYEDIYPLDFSSPDWRSLWGALLEAVLFWVSHGVQIFRVDNPHTKPLRFWDWLISEVHEEHPEVIFLSEAFTRPNVMQRLAKGGFTQSYTYFTWRNTRWELEQYLTEVHSSDIAEFFRPNFWPNTPDILTEYLQHGGRPGFMARLVLAATGVASYGIYGPVFELCENQPRTTGSEEYLNSEKYEVRQFDRSAPANLGGFVARVNEIRRECAVLQHDRNLVICPVDNDHLIAYARTPVPRAAGADGDGASAPDTRAVLVVVNLDPHNRQSGWVDLDLHALGVGSGSPYEVHELLTGAHYSWEGARNFVIVDPEVVPAHILRVGAGEGDATAR